MKWRRKVLLLLALLSACGGGDMSDQPKLEVYEEESFFKDGRASRPLPKGTIARGRLREDEVFYSGKKNGRPVRWFPIKITRETLEKGRERFDVSCAVCHDRTGSGMGMIVRRGFTRPPSLHLQRLRQAPEGYFFDVITNGFGRMPAMAYQTTPEERWEIVAYIRALQLSRNARLADVPPEKKDEFK